MKQKAGTSKVVERIVGQAGSKVRAMAVANTATDLQIVEAKETQKDLNRIDSDYHQYLNNTFKPSFSSKKKTTPATQYVNGNITRKEHLFKVSQNTTYAISNSKEDKLMAAILQGIKHYSEFEFGVVKISNLSGFFYVM